MNDLIERLLSVKWDVIAEGDRMPDDPAHECVFVDMRPDDFRALLREAADALEAAREDGWQPMETAPKDGTRVLLRIEWSDEPVVGEFTHDRWRACTEHYEVSCGAYCYGGSVSSDKDMKPIAWARIPPIDTASECRALAAQAPVANADVLLDALRQIAEWPDGGNRYGQEKIKRFAQHAINAAIDQARGKGVAGGA